MGSELKIEKGIVVGNVEDKSNLANPLARLLVKSFDQSLLELVQASAPTSILEAGCGEARVTRMLSAHFPVPIRATDLSKTLIEANSHLDLPLVGFVERDVYELVPAEDSADILVCCEVLEHLEHPGQALDVFRNLGAREYVFTVPREPLWRALNVLRGRYVSNLGNTPGHLNHWSTNDFLSLLRRHGFQIRTLRTPLPWTMVRVA